MVLDRNGFVAVIRARPIAYGQIIGFLGSDDTYSVDVIQTVVDSFREDVYFLFGSCNYIKNGKLLKTVMARKPKKDELINGRFWVYGPAMFLRRELLDEIGLFTTSDDYALASDIDFLIRVSKKYNMDYTTKVLGNFRTRPWLLNGKSWERSRMVLKATYKVTKDYGGKCTWTFMVYSLSLSIDFLRPILQPLYTLIDKELMRRWNSE
jgi:hypothetical protein